MAKNSVRDFDATAANNTDIQSVDIAENCAPSGINNAIRELMADIKDVSTGTIALESPQADSLTVTGDLTVDTNTLFVDSTNNRVGIGGTPSHLLDIQRATNGTQARFIVNDGSINPRLMIYGSASGSHIQHTSSVGSKSLIFEIDGSEGSGTEAARIDGTRTLGVGTTNLLDASGYVSANGAVYGKGFATANDRNDNAGFLTGLGITNGNNASTNNGLATGRLVAYVGGRTVTSDSNADDDSGASLEFYTKGENAVLSRKMVLDSSGNLLVGKTSNDFATSGFVANANGLGATRSGGACVQINRTSSDGSIQEFYKDGTIVGNIGSGGGGITFGAGSSGSERMRISATSPALSIGKTTFGTSGVGYTVIGNSAPQCYFNKAQSGAVNGILFYYLDTYVGGLNYDNTSTSLVTSSDERLKDNIENSDDAGAKIDAMQVRQFDWKSTGEHQEYGFVAQELEPIFAHAVHTDKEGDYKSVDYACLVPMLVKEIQSLRQRITDLENS